MKRTSLSKSFRTFGLMAMLSVVVATTLQQSVQAQSKGNKVPTTADGTCAPLPEGTFYQEFGGITFSQKQKAAYRKIEAKIKKRYKPISDNPQLVVTPESGLSTEYKPGVSDEKKSEIGDAMNALVRDNLSNPEQVKVLTKKYGKYAKFSLGQAVIYTPKQIVEGQQIGLDFEAQTMAILTPAQQNIYQSNLAIQRRIQACVDPTPFARIISPLPY